MSHFTVIIVGDAGKEENINAAMEPWMENCCGTPDRRYMTFEDREDEMLERYEKGTSEKVLMPDGSLVEKNDERFRVPGGGVLGLGIGTGPGTHKVPDDCVIKEVPNKELYPTFEAFAEGWYGMKERDELIGRYGYWQNPKAKWDWFEVGGRWAGFFKLKHGKTGFLGAQYAGIHGGTKEDAKGFADRALKGDIDFETRRRQEEESAGVAWEAVQKAIAGTPEHESWASIRDGVLAEDMHGHDRWDEARKKYHAQPRVAAFNELSKTEKGREMFGFFGNVDSFNMPKEQYMRNARNKAGCPHAVLMGGEWLESGQMGWFGCSTEDKDPETWAAMFTKIIDGLPDDTLLTLVDCHI